MTILQFSLILLRIKSCFKHDKRYSNRWSYSNHLTESARNLTDFTVSLIWYSRFGIPVVKHVRSGLELGEVSAALLKGWYDEILTICEILFYW